MFVKCKLLKKDGLIKDVFTERGDIKVIGDIFSRLHLGVRKVIDPHLGNFFQILKY